MFLHFVSLENNKMFLLVADDDSVEDAVILEECRRLYLYCQENEPQKIVYSMPLTDANDDAAKAEVEETVRLFQNMFGEDDVSWGATQPKKLPETESE